MAKADTEGTAVQEEQKHEGMTMVLFSGDFDKVMAAFIIANGAAAMDIPVTMFFTFWGTNVLRVDGPISPKPKKTFMEKMFGKMMPKGPKKLKLSKMNMMGMGTMMMKKEMQKKNVYDLPKLIDSARELGVRLIACTMTMDIMGIKKEELMPGIEFGGVGTFVSSADDSRSTLFI